MLGDTHYYEIHALPAVTVNLLLLRDMDPAPSTRTHNRRSMHYL